MKKYLKILYAKTHFAFGLKAGGSVGHTLGVIKGLSTFNHVKIISNELLYGLDNINSEIVKPFGKNWRAALLYNFYFAPRLKSKIRSFCPDFIYQRYNGYSFAVALVCRQLNVPFVLEFNSSDLWKLTYWDKRKGIKSKAGRMLSRLIIKYTEPFNLRSAALIVVVSDPLKEELVIQGIPAGRILVNPNAVDVNKFMTQSDQIIERLKKDLAIPSRCIIIGFSGTFEECHGIPELAEAVKSINGQPGFSESLFFVFFGDGKLKPIMQSKIGSFPNVNFTGIIEYESIQDYLSICDIFVAPHGKTADGKKFFGSPTKIFEYMAMGKGIVASDLGQIGEVLEHGKTAWLVKPGDVDSLVKGMKVLINDKDLRNRLGQAAKKEVAAKYTWEKHTQKIIEKWGSLKIDLMN